MSRKTHHGVYGRKQKKGASAKKTDGIFSCGTHSPDAKLVILEKKEVTMCLFGSLSLRSEQEPW